MESLDDSILRHSKMSISGLRIQSIVICITFSIVHFFEYNLIWHKSYGIINCNKSISILSLDSKYFSLYSNLHYSEYPNYFSCHFSVAPYFYMISYFIGCQISLIFSFWKSLNFSPKKCFTIGCLFSLIFMELLSLVSFYWISILLKFFLGISNGFIIQYGIILMMDWSHPKYVGFRANCIIGSKIISLIFLITSIKFQISMKVTYFMMSILFVFLIFFQIIFVKESRSYLKLNKNYDLLIHYLRSLARKVDYHGEAITENNINKLNRYFFQSPQQTNDDLKNECERNDNEEIERITKSNSNKRIKNSYKKYFYISITFLSNFFVSFIIQNETLGQSDIRKENGDLNNFQNQDKLCLYESNKRYILITVALTFSFLFGIIFTKRPSIILTITFILQIIMSSLITFQWFNNSKDGVKIFYMLIIAFSVVIDHFLQLLLFQNVDTNENYETEYGSIIHNRFNQESDHDRITRKEVYSFYNNLTLQPPFKWNFFQFSQIVICFARVLASIGIFMIFYKTRMTDIPSNQITEYSISDIYQANDSNIVPSLHKQTTDTEHWVKISQETPSTCNHLIYSILKKVEKNGKFKSNEILMNIYLSIMITYLTIFFFANRIRKTRIFAVCDGDTV
ncbi:Major facilitator superfamily domain, general substrate transporter-containing protein [Strongyloides ratti]|uniref:Major facilitator superfamily domain, general substrate transporter-containing protein n=1 Tax=Strongyloides ratti TaxID=34506 RepID=A0A090L6K3_STRRB|nr:Major facilitator superfamily domain, general substrate transporter-containing protein [Strongyloides ratti]CEF63713.1 Major facilitator superfamily domain, general substrate transporter-containing protein [Strongyloides ratti]